MSLMHHMPYSFPEQALEYHLQTAFLILLSNIHKIFTQRIKSSLGDICLELGKHTFRQTNSGGIPHSRIINSKVRLYVYYTCNNIYIIVFCKLFCKRKSPDILGFDEKDSFGLFNKCNIPNAWCPGRSIFSKACNNTINSTFYSKWNTLCSFYSLSSRKLFVRFSFYSFLCFTFKKNFLYFILSKKTFMLTITHNR